jgi:WD40-like Beta Propeller Repeat
LQLTSFGGELDGTPRWSPDGRWIVFDRRPDKHSQIYVIDLCMAAYYVMGRGDLFCFGFKSRE